MADYVKDFAAWHKTKKQVNERSNLATFREGDIWWCSTGVNVGFETDGKQTLFERPVLVVRKFGRHLFWGVPVTTKLKANIPNRFVADLNIRPVKGRLVRQAQQRMLLSQLRSLDARRLNRQLGRISRKDLLAVRTSLRGFLNP